MNEKKQRRFPADRMKLHALLEKKEQELSDLQEEVEELRERCQEADRTAIHATVEMYNLSVDQLREWLREKFGDQAASDCAPAILPEEPEMTETVNDQYEEGRTDDEA